MHEFSSLHNEVFAKNDYDEFLKVQNQIFALIGKPKSLRRSGFQKRINGENKETKNEYSILMKVLNLKNKQFEEDYFNNFLEEENLKSRQNKVFDFEKSNDVIKKSSNKKTKQKFESLVTEIGGATIPVEHKKPQLKIPPKPNLIKNIYPSSHVFPMKIIGARGTGKTIFLIALLHSLVFERIIKYEDVLVFYPTFNQRIQ